MTDPLKIKAIPLFDQFHLNTHPYKHDVIDVKVNCPCGYQSIATLLGMRKIYGHFRMNLFKEIGH